MLIDEDSVLGSLLPHVLWKGYNGIIDKKIPHGSIGNFLFLWTLAMFGMNLGMITWGVQLPYVVTIGCTGAEGGAIFLALVALIWINMGTSHSLKALLSGAYGKRDVVNATISRNNASNDLNFVQCLAVFMIVEMTLMITYATTVTVTPNLNAPAAATVITNLNGDATLFQTRNTQPAGGLIDMRFVIHFWIVIKCAVAICVYLDRNAILSHHEKLAKLEATEYEAVEEGTEARTQAAVPGKYWGA